VALVGTSTVLAMVIGITLGIYAGVATGQPVRRRVDVVLDVHLLGARLLVGHAAARLLRRDSSAGSRPAGSSAGSTATGGALLDQAHHMVLPALTLTLAYIGEYMIVMRSSTPRHRRRGLPATRPREGPARCRRAPTSRRPECAAAGGEPAALNFGFMLSGAIAVEAIFSWPGLGQATLEAIRGPDFPMLQGLFLLFSVSLIVANLVVDLLYAVLDPRVAGR
jgi:peptide/nickel transport system permease protein